VPSCHHRTETHIEDKEEVLVVLERVEEGDDEGVVRGGQDFLICISQSLHLVPSNKTHLFRQGSLDLVPLDHLLLRQDCYTLALKSMSRTIKRARRSPVKSMGAN
jgi:hypothetical protein